ncbi:50S ribosomal protein L13 [uncultured archaeon]|nr:50S ribosomal protein L13 [uncultured archaeon]
MLYIDADNSIYGRLSTYVAKSLLNGEEVVVVNAAKAVVTGRRDSVLQKFLHMRDIGSVRKGPYYPRTPDKILRRSIGDMLPKKQTRGKEALRRCTVYAFVPDELKGKDFLKIDKFANEKVNGFVTLAEIAKIMGQKVRE